jgi:hypothetical protein
MKNFVKIVGVSVGLAVLFLFDVMSLGFVPEAEAIAGVRRRTARRTAVIVASSTAAAASASTAAAQQQQAAAPAPAPTALVASLPAGCVADGAVFQCGNVYYKAYMSGNQIVYGVVLGP